MHHALPARRWSTASFGHPAAASPLELSALGEHLALCRRLHGGMHGRIQRLRGAAEKAHGFVAARFVTTLLAAAVLIGAASLLA
jgi:hypothetical protein